MNNHDLVDVNHEVNRLPYVSDAERYGKVDYWARIDEEGGDCEDFALGKLNRLLEKGWPIARLRLAVCRVPSVGTGKHGVLSVTADDSEYILCNMQARPMTLGDAQRGGYVPESIQQSGGSGILFCQWLW